MSDRKLATIRVISQLKAIKDADLIEVAVIDGWEVVIKKGEFNVGDLCVYLEIDSWVPHQLAPFLSKGKEPREYKGVKGERLRTVKLKGQLSQGLILPISVLPELVNENQDDVTEMLGILKWEPTIPAQLAGKLAGNFPSFIPKTDQERIQNCIHKVTQYKTLWEISEKLDGSSMTVFQVADTSDDGLGFKVGVCSRNYELKLDDTDNSFVNTTIKLNLFDKLAQLNSQIALQGELIGPGIQGNAYALSETDFYVYDIYDIVQQRYLYPTERQNICSMLGIKHVPLFASYETNPRSTIQELLAFAEGQSSLNNKAQREGLVFKDIYDPSNSFKAISNKWLLKNE